ncbi:MAG: hypothetical protein KIT80_13395 [Chitinophagaceae bacterium]|nr:hypothetical protein [Chitinophagaceae bacterium]MCW5927903.1 hypothetical protein [Chitinophagaceae bacterium]
MKISGKAHEVHNLFGFLQSYLQSNGKPNVNTYQAAANLTVYLAPKVPLPSFFPNQSLKVTTGQNGAFSFNAASLNKAFDYFLIAYKKTGEIKVANLPSIPIYEPVYRSDTFKLKDISNFNFYFAGYAVPKEKGITNEQIKAKANDAKKKIKDLKKISTSIASTHINVKAEGRGAEITFDLDINPYTGFDLNRFIKHQLKKFDVDLPGPDFLTGLCVSKDDIEKEVNKGFTDIMKQVSGEIKDLVISQIASQTGLPKNTIKTHFDGNATMTVSSVTYPVLKTEKVLNIPITFRSVTPKISFGFPRKVASGVSQIKVNDKTKLQVVKRKIVVK